MPVWFRNMFKGSFCRLFKGMFPCGVALPAGYIEKNIPQNVLFFTYFLLFAGPNGNRSTPPEQDYPIF
jgi:hypothetical protein